MGTSEIPCYNLHIDEKEIEDGTKSLMTLLRPSWTPSDTVVMKFTGGIGSRLIGWRRKEDDDMDDVVLIRIFDEKTQQIYDSKAQLQILSMLHASRLSPPVYASFNNGIAHGFVPGETLNIVNVRDEKMISLITAEMARLHAVRPSSEQPQQPVIFTKLRHWLSVIRDMQRGWTSENRNQPTMPSVEVLQGEVELLDRELSWLGSPVVFCHNDLYAENIVYNKMTGALHFIDFEHAAFNYQAYDIAVHFNEYTGCSESPDFSLYPEKQYQLRWLRMYLEHHRSQAIPSPQVTDEQVDALYGQVNKMSLVAHIGTVLWSIIHSWTSSNINFDYLRYGTARLEEYFKQKKRFLY